jgi:lipoprotein NlpD
MRADLPVRSWVKRVRALAALALIGLVVACSSTRVIPSRGWRPPGTSVGRDGSSAVVQRGDTLYSIAFRNGLNVNDMAAWNGLGPPFTIYPGQRLRLLPPQPGAATTRPSPSLPAAPAPPAATTAASNGPATTTLPTVPAIVPNALRWQWPTDGAVIASFAAGDPTRQGVDIAGKEGQPVRAAADGVVVYSGAGLVGYGELIIIKHDEHWLSAYGHNRARLVNEGQRVQAGEVIAEMGHSGASRDMLHFEIRFDGKPVDPARYLPPR